MRLNAERLESRELLSANQITYNAATSQVVIDGAFGADQVAVYSTSADSVTVQLTSGGETAEKTFARAGVASISFFGREGNDRFENFTNVPSIVDGGTGNDELIGGTGNDDLAGSHGDDVIRGGDGDDQLRGDNGNDLVQGDAGNDVLMGSWGNDDLQGGHGNDTLNGGEDDDNLDGGNGADTLNGDNGHDFAFGGWGDDVVAGGHGDDLLYGGEDNDQINGGNGNDQLHGNEGNDSLTGSWGEDRLLGYHGDDTLIGGENDDVLSGGNGADVVDGNVGNDKLFGGWGIDTLRGGDGDDLLHGGADNDNLDGGNGNDWLDGYTGNDTLAGVWGNDELFGGNDDDTLIGGEDNDSLDGGNGNDSLDGNNGNDVLVGAWGDDTIVGSDGDDVLYGGAGVDSLDAGNGNDTLYGNTENDVLTGGWGADRLYGSHGDDVLYGGDDADELFGDGGNDLLFGHGGIDFLMGGTGNDELTGGTEHDLLDGGQGADTLQGETGNDVLIGGTEVDVIRGSLGDDLLIGGSTIYDNNLSPLRLLLAEWSNGTPYATRIATIESETFAARLESTETVFDDLVADALVGGEDQDWFFRTGALEFYSPLAGGHHHEEEPSEPHHHPGPTAIGTLPPLEGFEFIDSLDFLQDMQSNERIHSKIPHSDNDTLQREHLALFELVRYDEVTHIAIANGAWSAASTWQDGVIPASGARVLIPMGIEVTVDGVIPTRLATVRVDGTLSFSTTANSELRVDTIVVSTSGAFEMGTAAAPVPAGIRANVVFTDDGPIDRSADPFAMGRGLVSHGRVSMHGAQATSHLAIIGSALAGTRTLHLAAIPVGWQAGNYVVLAATTAGTTQNEVRRISSINGTTVLLDQALAFNHVPSPGQQVHIAHMARNVTLESESTAVDRRGHAMFMHNRNVHIANAGFYRLGRTNKLAPVNDPVVDANWNLEAGTGTNPRARYAVHFHRTGSVADGNPSVVEGSVVWDSPGWGFVNHSSYVDIRNNVAFDVDGAAFSSEVGDEVGSFHNNIAIGSTGSGEHFEARQNVQDFGHQGDGFWFQGGGVTVTNNVAAGNNGHAFAYYTRGLIEGGVRGQFLSQNLPDPSIAGGATTIDVSHVPIFQFEQNTGYASGTGLSVFYQLRNAPHNVGAVLENSSFWNNTTGGDLSYSLNTTLRNMSFTHTFGEWPAVGIRMNDVTADITYDNLTVTGYTWGIDVPRYGQSTIIGGHYNNKYNIVIDTAVGSSRSVLVTGPITFGILPPELGDIQHFDIHLRPNLNPIHGSISHVFSLDFVTLNYGPFVDQRVYYTSQEAGFKPFPLGTPGVPSQYLDKTNAQLQALFGVSIGGAIAPAPPLVVTVPRVSGLVALPGTGQL